MKFEITFKDGRWLVNGKRLSDLNHDEKNFLDDFFREMKVTFEQYDSSPSNRTYSRIGRRNLRGHQTEVEPLEI